MRHFHHHTGGFKVRPNSIDQNLSHHRNAILFKTWHGLTHFLHNCYSGNIEHIISTSASWAFRFSYLQHTQESILTINWNEHRTEVAAELSNQGKLCVGESLLRCLILKLSEDWTIVITNQNNGWSANRYVWFLLGFIYVLQKEEFNSKARNLLVEMR